MIADTATSRTRRTVVAGGVLLAHALLVWIAMVVRSDRDGDESTTKSALVTMMIDLPREHLQGPVPTEPKMQNLPLLQRFAPRIQDTFVEQFEIEMPESEVAESPQLPIAADSMPASAPLTGQSDAGLAGNAFDSDGRAGNGDGLVLLQRVLPVYPSVSARQGEQGVTIVLLHIAESGRVDDVKVERSSGSRHLDRAAVDAFRKWRFQPLPQGSAPGGRWLRTVQRFVMYRFTYSRLLPGAAESVYEEHLKPKSGAADEATPGSQEALIRFIAQVRDQTFDVPAGSSRAGLAEMRAALGKWGAARSVSFTGMAGSSRWMKHRIRPVSSGGVGQTVEVSWNMFEVRHENATSEWLIATDGDGQIWAARAGEASWK